MLHHAEDGTECQSRRHLVATFELLIWSLDLVLQEQVWHKIVDLVYRQILPDYCPAHVEQVALDSG